MTAPGGAADSSVLLLDIEGTTTPITFVHDVLFPYARARLRGFLEASSTTLSGHGHARALQREHLDESSPADPPPPLGEPVTMDGLVAYAAWLMDRDRKSPALKAIQGEIWEGGYRDGHLQGEVFRDVPPAIRRWHAVGRRVAIYSSGSELAQRRLFATTAAGDLTPLLAAFFDTRMGPKLETASYTRIAAALKCAPGGVHFLSDVTAELKAARSAGCRVTLVSRPGNPPQPFAEDFPRVASFDALYFDNPITS